MMAFSLSATCELHKLRPHRSGVYSERLMKHDAKQHSIVAAHLVADDADHTAPVAFDTAGGAPQKLAAADQLAPSGDADATLVLMVATVMIAAAAAGFFTVRRVLRASTTAAEAKQAAAWHRQQLRAAARVSSRGPCA